MTKRNLLGSLEFQVLAEVRRHPNGICGIDILKALGKRRGKMPTVGAIYSTLARLEASGFLEKTWGEPMPVRGGRRRAFYTIAPAGMTAFDHTKAVLDAA